MNWCCLVILFTFTSAVALTDFFLLSRSSWSLIIACESRNILSVSSWSSGDRVRKIFSVTVIHLFEKKRQHPITFSKFSGKSDSACFYNSGCWGSASCVVHDSRSELWGGCAASAFSWVSLGKPVLRFLPTPRWKAPFRDGFLRCLEYPFEGYMDHLRSPLFTLGSHPV